MATSQELLLQKNKKDQKHKNVILTSNTWHQEIPKDGTLIQKLKSYHKWHLLFSCPGEDEHLLHHASSQIAHKYSFRWENGCEQVLWTNPIPWMDLDLFRQGQKVAIKIRQYDNSFR